ncbi:MAG: metallophosphoesterase [Deltaproteobacteria bacterium]|nr:metallophosphoesterase [Candidatus Zymogenaceae bacterium]
MIGIGKRRTGRFTGFCGLTVILLIVCGSVSASGEDTQPWNEVNLGIISVADPEDFTFAVFGDAQEGVDVFPVVLDMMDNDADISFAIGVGDLVTTGSAENYDSMSRLLSDRMTKPLLWVAGNHEYMAGGRTRYKTLVGPADFSFVVVDVTFVMLDGADPSRPPEERVAWLERELNRARERGMCLVFLHRPLFDPRGEGYAEALDETWAGELLRLFQTYRVHHVFCGHVHGSFHGRWEGVPYAVTGGAGGTLDGDDPNTYFYHYLKANVSGNALRIGTVRVPIEKNSDD